VGRASAPKQFAKTLGDKSFLELTVERLGTFLDPADIYISTGASFERELKVLIPQIPVENFILESEMKDTGMAVAYATKVLLDKDPNEPFGIFWSDHMVRDIETFKKGFEAACKTVKKSGKMVYFEVPIRFPDVNRGYVELGEKLDNFGPKTDLYEFKKFLEKPDLKTAQYYFDNRERFVCNTGYLVSTPQMLHEKFKKYAPDISDLLSLPAVEAFGKAPKMSFDYAIAEKLKPGEVLVIKSDFGYHDLGEWVTIKQAFENTTDENVVLSGLGEFLGVKNSLLYGQKGKLVALIGVEGVGVIDTKDALLVLNLKDSNKVKELVSQLKDKGLGKYT
jgi:mannose-1-phosphate guanylyltransferase